MDERIFLLINRQWTSPALDWLMAVMSSFAVWLLPLIVLGVCVVAFGGFKARIMILSIAIVVGIGDGLVADSLKRIVHRPRPNQVLSEARIVDLQKARPRFLALFKAPKIKMARPTFADTGGRSFPSSHIVNNFAVAVVLAVFYRRRGWLYFFPAALVAYSRIYVGSHWPSDALASTFLGAGIALLILPLIEFAWRKCGARLMPRTYARHPRLLSSVGAESLSPM